MAETNSIDGVKALSDTRISDYSQFFNTVSKKRFQSSLPSFDNRMNDCIYAGSGLPNPDTFILTETTIKLRDGTMLHLTGDKMKEVSQYGPTPGDPMFRKWLLELQRRLHDPPTLDDSGLPSSMDLILNTGCSEGLSKVMATILNNGDAVLTEEYTYPGIFDAVVPLGARAIPVVSDEQGIVASKMEEILLTWNEKTNGKLPKVLYCISSVNNPTSVTSSVVRKREIYKIAHKYNLLIVEDDPYYMLQFNKPYIPSFLSMDVDGRVIRLDSFSKIMSAGARLGYVSGPKQFLAKIVQYMSTTILCVSKMSQAVIFEILKHLGHDGFIKHGMEIRDFYQTKATKANQLAEKHLKGLVSWLMPAGGMFLWIKLLRIEDSSEVVDKAAQRGAVFIAGKCFRFNSTVSNYIRVAFSLVSGDQLDKAFAILAEVIKAEEDL